VENSGGAAASLASPELVLSKVTTVALILAAVH